MLFVRGCPRALSSALAAIGIVALFLLLLQSKRFYEDFQKYQRLQNYKQYIYEVSLSMEQSEKEANLSIQQLENLNQVLQQGSALLVNGSSSAKLSSR